MHLKRSVRQVSFIPVVMGCMAGCVAYHAAPLDPAASRQAFESRSLNDPALRQAVERSPAPGPTTREGQPAWDLDSLTRAAFRLHPDVAVARAHLAAVRAGRATAAELPNPTLNLGPEYTFNPGDISPWVLGISFDIPIETAGKREIRMAQAEALSNAAGYELAEAAWKVRSRLRDALAEYLFSREEAQSWETEAAGRSAYLKVLEARLAAGEAGRAEVDVARVDLLTAKQSAMAARGRSSDADAKLAAAVGVPLAGLGDSRFVWDELEEFSPLDEDAARQLQSAGLLNRLDVRRSLAEYAGAEAALRQEIAKQYPDIHFQPGYLFDQGENKFQFGFSFVLPVLNQNRGAIGEAEARRAELQQKFLGLQAQVIGDTESAVTRYRSALAELEQAKSEIRLIEGQLNAGKRALEVGEQDRLTVAGLEVQYEVAQRLKLEAARKAQAARAAIEDAIERPLPAMSPTTRPVEPETQPAQPATTQAATRRED